LTEKRASEENEMNYKKMKEGDCENKEEEKERRYKGE
jgi:hypothetical protein